jgi:tetratricopeptide (TPR) repeat protein
MSSLKRGDLFLASIPADLQREARSLLIAILRKIPIHPTVRIKQSETLLAEGQPCLHRFSLLQMDPIDADQRELFAVVDAGATAVGFPRRLFAAHLIALGDRSRNPIAAEGMFQRAIDIFPGDDSVNSRQNTREDRSQDDVEEDNENNCLAYYGLANALGDQGHAARALELMQIAIRRSPRWARANQERIRAAIPTKEQRHIVDPLARFWLDVFIP